VERLAGGALVGLSASVLLAANGTVAGISSIVGGVVVPRSGNTAWRIAFLAGLVSGAALLAAALALGASGGSSEIEVPRWVYVLAAGRCVALPLVRGRGARLLIGRCQYHGHLSCKRDHRGL
jgi:hypothetical protein